jgi:hypothetical protein
MGGRRSLANQLRGASGRHCVAVRTLLSVVPQVRESFVSAGNFGRPPKSTFADFLGDARHNRCVRERMSQAVMRCPATKRLTNRSVLSIRPKRGHNGAGGPENSRPSRLGGSEFRRGLACAANDQANLQPAVADVTARLSKPAELDAVGVHSANGWAFVGQDRGTERTAQRLQRDSFGPKPLPKAGRLEDTNGLPGSRRR